jgi:bacterial surface protein 26-residue repeat protein (3 repeats) (fragment)
VTDMSWMFFGCESLRTLDLSNFDTAKVTDMSWMFDGCESLTDLDPVEFRKFL